MSRRASVPKVDALPSRDDAVAWLDPEVPSLCNEMRTTEGAYAADHRLTRDLFLNPMRKLRLLSSADLDAIFSNAS